jgi:hypothetical protein
MREGSYRTGAYINSSRENRVGHSFFKTYLDLCLPTTKNSDACFFSSFYPYFSLLLFFSLPLRPPLLPLLALLCLLSLILALSLTHDLSQECRQVSPFGTRRRTVSVGIPKGWTFFDCS